MSGTPITEHRYVRDVVRAVLGSDNVHVHMKSNHTHIDGQSFGAALKETAERFAGRRGPDDSPVTGQVVLPSLKVVPVAKIPEKQMLAQHRHRKLRLGWK